VLTVNTNGCQALDSDRNEMLGFLEFAYDLCAVDAWFTVFSYQAIVVSIPCDDVFACSNGDEPFLVDASNMMVNETFDLDPGMSETYQCTCLV